MEDLIGLMFIQLPGHGPLNIRQRFTNVVAPHVTMLELIGLQPKPDLPRFNAWVERLRERPSYVESAGPAAQK